MLAWKTVLEKSDCHTYDRLDFRAQKDSCGIGVDDESDWKLAVQSIFNMTHFPYIHNNRVYDCVQTFFTDSYSNLIRENGVLLKATAVIALSLSLVI